MSKCRRTLLAAGRLLIQAEMTQEEVEEVIAYVRSLGYEIEIVEPSDVKAH